MKRMVIILLAMMILVGVGLGQKKISKPFTHKDIRLVKEKAEMLGFKTLGVRKARDVYMVAIVGFSAKTKALKLKGKFLKFTAKVIVIRDKKNQVRGVEPSPFILFNKKQLRDLNYLIDEKVLVQGDIFK